MTDSQIINALADKTPSKIRELFVMDYTEDADDRDWYCIHASMETSVSITAVANWRKQS